jgi:hypothetical protein
VKESDLYLPLKRFLQAQHYEVKGEVHDCDVVAIRGREAPIVVELKRALNLDVVVQAVERLSLTPKVYIAIPKQSSAFSSRRRHIVKLLRMLGVGLMLIDADHGRTYVEVLLDPGEYRPRRSKSRQERLLGEFTKRVGDPNLGGSDRRTGIMTVYRQRSIAIARFLQQQPLAKASHIAATLRDPKARDILYRDVYGWFDRVSLGVYALSPRGQREILRWPPPADQTAPESQAPTHDEITGPEGPSRR